MPMTIGAEVLIPKDFDKHPGARYPAIYTYGHFGGSFNFDTDPASDSEGARRAAADANVKTGYRFAQEWSGEKLPRMVGITIETPGTDRTTVVQGKSVAGRVGIGSRCRLK